MRLYRKVLAVAVALGLVVFGASSAAAWPPPDANNITSLFNDRCIDADWNTIGANGTRVHLWDCYGTGSLNQRWTITYLPGSSPVENPRGPVQIRTFQNGRCLDADWHGIGANGTRVQLWDCYGSSSLNQLWYVERSTGSPFVYRIINAHSGRCLDADWHNLGRIGTPLQLWDCYGTASYNQYWRTFL